MTNGFERRPNWVVLVRAGDVMRRDEVRAGGGLRWNKEGADVGVVYRSLRMGRHGGHQLTAAVATTRPQAPGLDYRVLYALTWHAAQLDHSAVYMTLSPKLLSTLLHLLLLTNSCR